MDEIIDVEVFTLDDGNDYVLLDRFDLDNNTYLVLASTLDRNDFCVRKVDGDFLVGLDSNEEFDKVINTFSERNEDN